MWYLKAIYKKWFVSLINLLCEAKANSKAKITANPKPESIQ